MRLLAIASLLCAVGSSGCISNAIGEAFAAPFKGLAEISNYRAKANRKIADGDEPNRTIQVGLVYDSLSRFDLSLWSELGVTIEVGYFRSNPAVLNLVLSSILGRTQVAFHLGD